MNNLQFQAPPMTKGNRALLIALGASYLIQFALKLAGINLFWNLALSAEGLSSGHIYSLITYPFANNGFMGVLFNGLLLWFIGSDLEANWGMKRYLSFLAISIFGAGLIMGGILIATGSASPFYSFSGVSNALMLAYAVLYPDRLFSLMFIFPVKAKYFCGVIVAISVFMSFEASHFASLGHLIPMILAFGWMLTITRYSGKSKTSEMVKAQMRSMKVKKSHLRLVEDDDEGPKTWH